MTACLDHTDQHAHGSWGFKNKVGSPFSTEDFSGWRVNKGDSPHPHASPIRPSAAYSQRSHQLARLRGEAAWALNCKEEDFYPPTQQALSSAENFINALVGGCLDFRLAISHDGEINFFFGDTAELFQILIDENGALSYYAKGADGQEISGSDVALAAFPHFELLRFVDRKK